MRGGLLGLFLFVAGVLAGSGPAAGQVPQGSVRAEVRDGVAMVEVVVRVGFETTVVLPDEWIVVERRLGDPSRWVVTGAGHLTMVRPLARGATTNLGLVLGDGRVVSVGLRESEVLPVYTVVYLSPAAADGGGEGEEGEVLAEAAGSAAEVVVGTDRERPVFLSAVDVELIREREARALEGLRLASEEVRDRVEDAELASGEASETFEAAYPQRLHFEFEFNPAVDVSVAPYWVEGMWHDGESTFLRFRRAIDRELVIAGFLEDGSARVLQYQVIGVGLVVRIPGVIESGILGVGDVGGGVPWRMRGEIEPWRSGP